MAMLVTVMTSVAAVVLRGIAAAGDALGFAQPFSADTAWHIDISVDYPQLACTAAANDYSSRTHGIVAGRYGIAALDPLRITVGVTRLQLSGFQVGAILEEQHGVVMELATQQVSSRLAGSDALSDAVAVPLISPNCHSAFCCFPY